ncbi:hypothetical protein WAI453_003869 [Rhynchosporium graminicola]|uniref:Uncharacterized protein n=1 Tax=Rhynchosporium graminicola TaxID=2792576 RepID=A0A1E1JYM9_9HELO|nr:uncharacterized protein RCO7_01350 [Rhynchosporium commune]
MFHLLLPEHQIPEYKIIDTEHADTPLLQDLPTPRLNGSQSIRQNWPQIIHVTVQIIIWITGEFFELLITRSLQKGNKICDSSLKVGLLDASASVGQGIALTVLLHAMARSWAGFWPRANTFIELANPYILMAFVFVGLIYPGNAKRNCEATWSPKLQLQLLHWL